MPRRTRIDRRLAPISAFTTTAASVVPAGAMVVFRDSWGEIVQHFDLAVLALPADLTDLLAEAFRGVDAATTVGTRNSRWRTLRLFARFIVEDGDVRSARDLTTEAVRRFIAWLGQQRSRTGEPWAQGSRAVPFALLRSLLVWARRHRPDQLPPSLAIPYNPFPLRQENQASRPRLSEPHLKAILQACYEEIDEAWRRFEWGQAVVRAPELPPKILRGQGLARWLWRIYRIDNGLMPDAATLLRHGIRPSTLVRYWGGMRTIAQYFHLTTDTIVPFYLAIAIQTAANPDALRLIARDCLVPHPLDEHGIIVDWTKPKTGARLKRAQRRSFDCRRPHAAPNLIEKVLAMTAPLVPHARLCDRDRLFLVKGLGGSVRRSGDIAVADPSTLSNAISRFIERTNRRIAAWNATHPDQPPRRALAHFAPLFFRGSVATEHYRASGGDVRIAQSVLNHADAVTTEAYLKGPETRRLQRDTIARLQNMMLVWIGGDHADDPASSQGLDDAIAGPATVFPGHRCLSPMLLPAGPDDARRHLCPRFGGCLACPGLVVPIDADHLARVLQAIAHLEAARQRLDPRRWELFYGPTHRILVTDLLPDFPDELRPAAEAMLPALPKLPDVE
jgi:integrase